MACRTAVTVDHADGPRLEPARGLHHVLEQRPAGERVQHLRDVRVHPLAPAGGEDQDFKRRAHAMEFRGRFNHTLKTTGNLEKLPRGREGW